MDNEKKNILILGSKSIKSFFLMQEKEVKKLLGKLIEIYFSISL